LSILGVKTDAKVSENDPRRYQKIHFMSTFLARFGYCFKQLEMQKLRDFLELHAFGVCSAIGERLGIASSKIRMWFIYISFLTFGSPVIIYMVLAFWRSMKHNILLGKRNPLKY
jgi:phage shock protein PspC (stress-responsive transcriptional regulator)